MKKLINKAHLYTKFLISYIVIFLIPLTLMGIIVNGYFMSILKQDVINNNLNSLNKIKYVIDNQVSGLQKISAQMYLNQNLRPFYFSQDPFQAIKIKKELMSYSVSNNFIHEILIYYRGDNYIYSPTSSYTLSYYMEQIYKYGNMNADEFYKKINSVAFPALFNAESHSLNGDKEQFISYMYPLTADGVKPYGTAIFMISEKSLNSLLKNTLEDYDGNTLILDSNNNMVTGVQNKSYTNSKSFNELVNLSEDQFSKTVVLDNQKYFLSLVKSDQTGWKYATLVPVKNVMEKVRKVQSVFYYGVIAIFLVGSVAIYFLMHMNYNPIKQLKKRTEHIWKNSENFINEIEAIDRTLDYLSHENSKLNVKIKDSSIATKDFILFGLLTGEFASLEEVNIKGKDIGFTLNKDMYMVSILQINHDVTSIRTLKQNIMDEANMIIAEKFEVFAKDHIELDKIVLLIGASEAEYSKVEECLLSLQQDIKLRWGVLITIGCGNFYKGIKNIPTSYMEASSSIDYRLVKGIDKVILFCNVVEEQVALSNYPHKSIEELGVFIRQGNINEIENSIRNIVCRIKENNYPIFMARIVCFNIINVVAKTMDEISKEYILLNKTYPDVFALTKFETVDELAQVIKNLCFDICTYIQQHKEEEDSAQIKLMISYIREEYTDCDFSIQKMAEHFHMSLPALSQYFKDLTEQNISDYVTYLKIEKAKELLKSSDKPLQNISLEVGYYNVTSFIRRFKQTCGVTPGEYRKSYKL